MLTEIDPKGHETWRSSYELHPMTVPSEFKPVSPEPYPVPGPTPEPDPEPDPDQSLTLGVHLLLSLTLSLSPRLTKWLSVEP